MHIGLDLDDVLKDFNTALCRYVNNHYGTSFCREDITSYHLEEVWGCTREEAAERVWGFYNSPFHNSALPVSGAQRALLFLAPHATFSVITSRPESMRPQTEAWLEMHFPQLRGRIQFTNHFGGNALITRKKSEVCRELGVDYLVEDAPLHAEDVGIVAKVLLLSTPWNSAYIPTHKSVTRVHSWEEIARHLCP